MSASKYEALGKQPRPGRARAVLAAPPGQGAVLDAVTVIALLDVDEVHHAAAREVLRALVGLPKLIHPINLAEVLVRPVKAGTEKHVQAALRRAGIFAAPSVNDEPLALARVRATTGLKIPDTCAYTTAQARELPLVTFDRRLTIAARAGGLTVLGAPPEWQP